MLPESASPWTGVMILTDEAGQSLVTLLTPWWNIHRNWQLLQVPEESLETAPIYRLTE